MRSLPGGLVGSGLVLLSTAFGQQAGPPSRPQFAFRATTRLVQINVVVDGRDGPVSGLTAKDFTITDNGRRREIQVFSADSPSQRSPASAATAPAAANAPPTPATAPQFSNRQTRAPHMVVLLLDALNSADGTEHGGGGIRAWQSAQSFAMAKHGALAFLKQLPPGLSIALYGLDSHLRVLSDFTSDRARLLAALSAYGPHTNQNADIGGDRLTDGSGGQADAALAALQAADAAADQKYQRDVVHVLQIEGTVPALRAIADHVAGLPGRISLVWIMTRPPLPGAVVEAALGQDNIAVYPVDARGLEAWSLQFGADYPAGFSAVMQSQPMGLPVFEDIAEQTGGKAFINSNDIAGALRAAATDSEASYTLGFYVAARDLDNRFHQIRVQVQGRHLEARYPHGYWAMFDPAGAAPRGVTGLERGLDNALRSPLEASAIPLRAEVRPVSPGLELDATLGLQAVYMPLVQGQRQGALVIETVAQDVHGKPLQSSRYTLKLQLPEAEYRRTLQSGMQVKQAIDIAPHAVTLRVIVADEGSGALGSVIIPLGQLWH